MWEWTTAPCKWPVCLPCIVISRNIAAQERRHLCGPNARQCRQLLHVCAHDASCSLEGPSEGQHIRFVDAPHGGEGCIELGQVVLFAAALDQVRRLRLIALQQLQISRALLHSLPWSNPTTIRLAGEAAHPWQHLCSPCLQSAQSD